MGNVALIARRHEIFSNTIHTWIKRYRERGTAETLKKNGFKDLNTMTEQLKRVSTENDQLKRAAIADKWIQEGYPITTILRFVGLNVSTYYSLQRPKERSKEKIKSGRKIPGFSINQQGKVTWIKRYRERGTAKTLKKNGFKDLNTVTEQLKRVSTENDQLKRLLAEKELELAILR